MFLILLCLILGLAMLYLGIAQGQSGALVFGGILLAGAFFWTCQALVARRRPPEQGGEDIKKPESKEKRKK